MDADDLLEDLGWCKKDVECDILSFECNTDIKSDVELQGTASTSQVIDSNELPHNEVGDIDPNGLDNEGEHKPTVVKKKRGRPRREDLKDLQPTRESKRFKRSPGMVDYGDKCKKSLRNKWSQKDKTTFLSALEKYGPESIKEIKSCLPHKSEYEVKVQIRMWRELACLEFQKKMTTDKKRMESAVVNSVSKLDEWIEHFQGLEATSSSEAFALSQVFILISEFGNFPPPEECGGTDFKAMYRYLHCMLNSKPYFNVNPKTAQAIHDNICHMLSMTRDYNNVTNLQPYLYTMEQPLKKRWKNYGRQPCRQKKSMLNPEMILNLPHLNPLGILPHILMKPVVEPCDDDFDSSL